MALQMLRQQRAFPALDKQVNRVQISPGAPASFRRRGVDRDDSSPDPCRVAGRQSRVLGVDGESLNFLASADLCFLQVAHLLAQIGLSIAQIDNARLNFLQVF